MGSIYHRITIKILGVTNNASGIQKYITANLKTSYICSNCNSFSKRLLSNSTDACARLIMFMSLFQYDRLFKFINQPA